ncbi:venom carboxylesterase-6 [Trichogramma pretiosum]|uniref:venom carboxylesterase-6 n=1 Tax=Trichogramma pretiosum TaxID=7493 RepID=UPI0006C98362|nr:venom carboxylesterase-6 [Trichogramma pretiosum]
MSRSLFLHLPLLILLGLARVRGDDDDDDYPKVAVGRVVYRGTYKQSYLGRRYAAFEGIPYAEPPEGRLRFEEPVPYRPRSSGIVNATRKSDVCAQYYDVPPKTNGQPETKDSLQGSDDCLYLSVYVPRRFNNEKTPMPVIFFIHGGSFQYASGTAFGDKYLADRDVVFVTINYRLGVLGFLSTEDEVLPGNLGLKDQAVALRWTSDNIAAFGGDPSRVILAGFSAGSSSIQYHHLSPWSRGLFHGSVAMSGTAFNPWAFAHRAKEKARKLGKIFGCSLDSSRTMIDCLKKVPARDLANATKQFQYWQYNPEGPFAPVVERHGPRPFISKEPKKILESPGETYDVPAVYGAVSQEGCDPAAEYAPHANLLGELDARWTRIAPYLLESADFLSDDEQARVSREARQEYFGNNSISKETAWNLIELLTDQRYLIGFEAGIRLQARATRSPVYMYYYSFRASQSYSDHLSRTRNDYGVCHTDDMNLVVENPDIDPAADANDFRMSNFLMDMWESVAVNKGVPKINVDWRPVDGTDPALRYLHIEAPGRYAMSSSENFGNKKFWKRFFYTA